MQQHTSSNEKIIEASPQQLYHAFTDAAMLEKFLAPGEMTAHIHSFDLRPGGGYTMSLYYPSKGNYPPGKTNAKEDRFTSTFLELQPYERIKTTTVFDTQDPLFAGEMLMTILLKPVDNLHTRITIIFENIPPGIKPEDNELGTSLTLQKLENLVASHS